MDDHSDLCILKDHIDSHALTVGVAYSAICKVDAVKDALRNFDNSREAAQATTPCKSRMEHADILIARVRAILSQNVNVDASPPLTPKDNAKR